MSKMQRDKQKCYALFDSALIPQVWLRLDTWKLPYEPLYRYNYQSIAEAIPYLIELNKSINADSVDELSTNKLYLSGLFITSRLDINELIEKLAYFYHIIGPDNHPYLRRFFDIRLFDEFINSLSLSEKQSLFGDKTEFYYFSEKENVYNRYTFDKAQHINISKVSAFPVIEAVTK
ncbi:DUF4123 domain-containing protein [Bisgaard Taxon 10/6]|uniref:DUF4123 domain-containing protein n=1 Tax=Exercitatus varius TaxID=67857 RepID=UPI00294AE637|nr:DUF4123 domain-containing protein [Exercitatus varius]MDG2918555.1 DUF4123 domain-containing protein [Exercitatus varius]MDG2952947.1 DUF4123 domain-containing protein [Exercitatus varius]